MKIAYRYIFRELLGPMLFGVAAFVSILVAGKPLMELTKLAFAGVAFGDVMRLFFLSLPPLVVLTLPMSMLLATLLGFGRLSGDSEMVAMYAGGMSLYRAAIPVVILAVLVMAVTIFLNERVVPWSIDSAKALQARIEGQVSPQEQVELDLPQFTGENQTGLLRAESFDPRTGQMRNIVMERYKQGKLVWIASAESATRKSDLEWTMHNGYVTEMPPGRSPVAFFGDYDIRVQQTVDEMANQTRKPTDMSMAQLKHAIGVLHRQGRLRRIPEYEVAWWNRLAVPFASVVFALVGLPLGLRPQRASGGLGLGLSIVIIFLYWVVWDYTSKLGYFGEIPPFLASWTANFLGIGIGAALLARAPK